MDMPFTIGGEWISEEKQKPKPPSKIIKQKRGNSVVTLLLNLPLSPEKLKDLCSSLKRQLGCGGAVKGDQIELQGEKIEPVKKLLKDMGIFK